MVQVQHPSPFLLFGNLTLTISFSLYSLQQLHTTHPPPACLSLILSFSLTTAQGLPSKALTIAQGLQSIAATERRRGSNDGPTVSGMADAEEWRRDIRAVHSVLLCFFFYLPSSFLSSCSAFILLSSFVSFIHLVLHLRFFFCLGKKNLGSCINRSGLIKPTGSLVFRTNRPSHPIYSGSMTNSIQSTTCAGQATGSPVLRSNRPVRAEFNNCAFSK